MSKKIFKNVKNVKKYMKRIKNVKTFLHLCRKLINAGVRSYTDYGVCMADRFCGRSLPIMSLVTEAREVLVLFRSNWEADSVENVGFKLLYRLGNN